MICFEEFMDAHDIKYFTDWLDDLNEYQSWCGGLGRTYYGHGKTAHDSIIALRDVLVHENMIMISKAGPTMYTAKIVAIQIPKDLKTKYELMKHATKI